MSSPGSVTEWMDQLREGDPAAARALWERYFRRLVGLARKKLQDAPRRAADEEDVALSAFDSFCRGVRLGRFPELGDRGSLWRLLLTITARKANHLLRDEQRLKRGGAARGPGPSDPGLEQLPGREPTPEFAARATEEFQHLLARLDDAELQSIAVWKMEGCTNGEIMARLGCAPRSVERKLQLIRSIWAKEIAP